MSQAALKRLLSRTEIDARVAALAREIERDYRDRNLVAIGVLKSSFLFFADLVRKVELPLRCEFLGLSEYQKPSSSGEVKILLDIEGTLEGCDLLIVEDLVNTGLTLRFLKRALSARKPSSLRTCTLLKRKGGSESPDYVGFEIDRAFVVGYGIDHEGRYRELPYLATLEEP